MDYTLATGMNQFTVMRYNKYSGSHVTKPPQ